MTPAQLDSLARQHRRAHDPRARRAYADQGGTADLLMFANMRAV